LYTEQAALRLLNIAGADGPPVAACSYFHHFGALPDSYCLRADPVHLHTDTHGLVVFDCHSAGISASESRALAEGLADHLSLDGWTLRYADKCHWYLLGEKQDLSGPPICQVRGLHIGASVLKGGDARQWTRRLNELQMLLATHAVNRQRQSDRRKPINSLWLWGGGKPECRPAFFDAVVSGNSAVLGAAAMNHVKPVIANDAVPLLEQMGTPVSRCLVTLEHCRDAGAYADCGNWNQAVDQLEHQWFAPLLTALSRKQLDYIELIPLNGAVYRLTHLDLWKFWRKYHDYQALPGFRQESAART
jgi:hypothetical protein